MANSQTDFLKYMECPVCLDILRLPVRLCGNRHSICHDCHYQILKTSQIAKCPVCQEDFDFDSCPVKGQLYLTMEVTCRFIGCKIKGYGAEVIQHERRCIFRLRRCPWKGPQTWLANHYFVKHA
ncbi:hypothetical protein Zmor_026500 [Zophobas morio]|uniref:RING-type domain-containing protein n=1 Tax=Zophobas morio TaxID=2755281 RepID=A0AA38HWC0_9CUCU|nr:hypothetical protein Zmor_026500 [Zophobas morio]